MIESIGKWTREFKILAFAALTVGAFFGFLFTLFNNFIVARLGIEPHELGVVEAVRELPGLMNFLLIALLIRVVPARFAAVSLIILGIGVMGYTRVESVLGLAFFSVFWSFGSHCWYPLMQSMALEFSEGSEKGKALGRLRGVEGIGGLAAIVTCLITFRHIGYLVH